MTTSQTAPLIDPYNPSASPKPGPLDYLCVQTKLLPQSGVQNLVGNHPSIRTFYA